MKEFEKTRLGPASYKPEFNIVERRVDIGVLKMREPPKSPVKEQDEQVLDINPNYDFDKPNKLVFKYYEPSKDLSPTHTPDKELYPGKWRFYDFDLDAVREEIAKEITFARNLTPDQFKDKEEFHNLLVEHIKRQDKKPAVGQYDPHKPET